MSASDASVQGAPFYVENTRNGKNGVAVGHFQVKSHHKFSDSDPSNIIICKLNTLNNFFLYILITQKQPIMSLFSQFQLYLTFQSY